MNNKETEIIYRMIELESENETLRSENDELKKTLSQYQQPIRPVEIEGVPNMLLEEAG